MVGRRYSSTFLMSSKSTEIKPSKSSVAFPKSTNILFLVALLDAIIPLSPLYIPNLRYFSFSTISSTWSHSLKGFTSKLVLFEILY